MSQYNIEMNTYNGSTYDQLYPKTYLSNVLDWSSTIYSKTEVDNIINSNIENAKEDLIEQLQIPNFVRYQTKRINKTITANSNSSSEDIIANQLFPINTFYCYEDIIIMASGFIIMKDEKDATKKLKLIITVGKISYTYTFISQTPDIELSFSGLDTKSIFLIKYGFGMNNIGGSQDISELNRTRQYGIDLTSIYNNDYLILYENLYNGNPIYFNIDYNFIGASSSNVGTLNCGMFFTLYKRTNPLVANMFSLNT